MKALFIGYTDEFNTPIERLMERHFPSIELRTLKPPYSTSDLMIILTTDGPFSFLILSIDDWKVEIIDVYETIIETIGERPFLFIGNFASMKGQIKKEILDKPQTNFLITTPLLPNDLVDAVKSSVEWSKNEEFEESIQEFKKEDLQKMRMRNFYLFDQLPYDVYLELTPTQFGKIISKNRPYSHQIIRNYAKKNVKYLYLKSDEYLKFLDTAIKSMLTIYEAKSIERKKIVSLHLKTLFFIHQYLKTLSVSEDIIKLTKAFIESTRIFIKDQENITSLIEGVLESKNLTFAEQSLATAYVCEGMLLEMGWRSEMSRDKLLLASILQDIGLSNDEFIKIKSLHDPQLKIYSDEEQEIYRNHPQKGALISTFFYGFTDVDFILNEHHELPFGDGFPKGLNSSGLTTISCLFILATNFVTRFSLMSQSELTCQEVVIQMKRIYNSGNFKDPLKALEKVFVVNKS